MTQKGALKNYRQSLHKRGMARFEVRGRESDRDLIRNLARLLTKGGPDAARLRAALAQAFTDEPPRKGGILAALRRSPLVGADIILVRGFEFACKVDF